MKAIITPSLSKDMEFHIPPSKSMAHRAIICASLADGTSYLSNVDYSVDIQTTIEGMRKLGASIVQEKNCLTITGIRDFNCVKTDRVECNESGSTLRFLIPLFSMSEKPIRFTGKNRLLKRPQKVYEDLFLSWGNKYIQNEEFIEIEGSVKPGEIVLPGNVSSQFISGLLFVLPLCKKDSTLKVLPPFESKSYVCLTMQMMEKFGVSSYFIDDYTIKIPGNQCYHSANVTVEADYSQFAFFAALGCLNNSVSCIGMNLDSLQGDRVILDVVARMNGKALPLSQGWRIEKSQLKGTEIDLSDCPDLGPILMVLGSLAKGKTQIIHAQRLRMKESDRIAAMEEELRKLNVEIESTEDTVTITGCEIWPGGITLCAHQDHRIAMALAIGASVANNKIVIDQAECVEKSYPAFFEDLKRLGVQVEFSE